MQAFDLLHPALQHHIVNSLGWRELRPFQEAVIADLLAGRHALILAPTAGGKTEAAFFPVLSRMLQEDWQGLGLLYICPLKALLNNLDVRLARYAELVGRRSAVWHGDIADTVKRRLLKEPPDCLLTTPESLEAMLTSTRVEHRALLGDVRAVIIDEIHAFAGDDRGWHLLAVLERLQRLAGRPFQRIGLSATVGNPELLSHWLVGSAPEPARLFLPPTATAPAPEVELDYVGSLANAALVISRLHRGEKRLVFIDSRARAEELGLELHQREVRAFVTHGSLSREQRQLAEQAFASGENCVIVATSVLELGIDVGDLDRVIQIDAPTTVSSLLQRMGRTGRRPGSLRNCLLLATSEDALLQAAALVALWETGYVEPVAPPPAPLHILAQQLMALALQEGGIGRVDWRGWIGQMPGFAAIPFEQIEETIAWMLEQALLYEDAGIWSIGQQGEEEFGRRHFMELCSVFTSPPLFKVLHGRQELGAVDQSTFMVRQDGPSVLLLGGRAWRVTHVDWARRIAYTEPFAGRGRSRWWGVRPSLSFALCQSYERLLTSDHTSSRWSRRARETIESLRVEFAWLRSEETTILIESGGALAWWTFAGARANAGLKARLDEMLDQPAEANDLCLTWPEHVTAEELSAAVQRLSQLEPSDFQPQVAAEALASLKFTECLPQHLAMQMLQQRLVDAPAIRAVLGRSLRIVSAAAAGDS